MKEEKSEEVVKTYSRQYINWRRNKRKAILERTLGEALNKKSIITKYLIEDVVFDGYII